MSDEQIQASIHWRQEVKKLMAKHNKGYRSGNSRTEAPPTLPPKPGIIEGDQRRSVLLHESTIEMLREISWYNTKDNESYDQIILRLADYFLATNSTHK